ncbi:hypothetical protein B0H12DRAFT_1105035 [Mycena haematopus]|nr:hypothetical protein B0H12DRAFT_1105035 [Mycena haematopus]
MLAAALAVLATPVHGALFPYAWGSTLHAFRISLAFLTNVQMSGSRLSWGAHMAGFLLMCWGGTFTSHLLLSLPPPQLYAIHPWINYSAVHLFLTVLFHYLPIPDTSITNAFLFPLDGLLRATSVVHALSHLANPSVNPLLVASPLFHFFLGAGASAGGGLLGGTLNLWTSNWHFSTPPPLRTGVWGVWSTLDIWAGGVVASVYSALTAHPAFLPLRESIAPPGAAPLSVRDARAVSAALMIVLFGLRVYAVNTAAKPTVVTKPSEKKVKTQ